MITLGVDPDVKLSGWGLAENGVLLGCGFDFVSLVGVSLALIECPQLKPGTPNVDDLIALARVVGRWEDRYEHTRTVVIGPNWTRSVAKPVRHAQLLAQLQPAELSIICAAMRWTEQQVREYVQRAVVAIGERRTPTYTSQLSELLDACDISKRGETLTRYEIGKTDVPRKRSKR